MCDNWDPGGRQQSTTDIKIQSYRVLKLNNKMLNITNYITPRTRVGTVCHNRTIKSRKIQLYSKEYF